MGLLDVWDSSIEALLFRLKTFGQAVWPEILSPHDVLFCVKLEVY